jgi:hypothetical protein
VARELAENELGLVGIQNVRWDKSGTERAENYNLFKEKEIKFIN